MSATIPFLPIIIVFSINEVITGIQAVEQAKECGDTFFTTTKPLVISVLPAWLAHCSEVRWQLAFTGAIQDGKR